MSYGAGTAWGAHMDTLAFGVPNLQYTPNRALRQGGQRNGPVEPIFPPGKSIGNIHDPPPSRAAPLWYPEWFT